MPLQNEVSTSRKTRNTRKHLITPTTWRAPEQETKEILANDLQLVVKNTPMEANQIIGIFGKLKFVTDSESDLPNNSYSKY